MKHFRPPPPGEPDEDELVAILRKDVKRDRPEWQWLIDYREGRSADELATRCGISKDELGKGIQAAMRASKSPLMIT